MPAEATDATVLVVIRHGHCPPIGKWLAGRAPGTHLDERGREQALELAERAAHLPLSAIYSSPLERTMETAEPLARKLGLEINTRDRLLEIDFGEWTGKRFEELHADPRWHRYNAYRTGNSAPGGESVIQVQSRVAAELEWLRQRHRGQTVALFTHGDVVKSILALSGGTPLDLMLRFEISPASVSIVEIHDHGPRILLVNHCGGLPPAG